MKESSIEWQDGLYTLEQNRLSSVSNLLESLALELRHKIARLSFFKKLCTTHDQVLHADLFSYFDITYRPTHQCRSLHMIIPYTTTSAYQGSVFP